MVCKVTNMSITPGKGAFLDAVGQSTPTCFHNLYLMYCSLSGYLFKIRLYKEEVFKVNV